ncbi:hypothetical protein GCM10008959_40020 [Deinococcus seoulensis]|uniref:Uncharacterized protein n=1 Tax=Deinococcus seoulensis TaxID=1837379 RepID=A0ABQ2RWL8_9DEIO|nr:hypothetical protein GCM10008959_40020 [Deinococcus seoulensis]
MVARRSAAPGAAAGADCAATGAAQSGRASMAPRRARPGRNERRAGVTDLRGAGLAFMLQCARAAPGRLCRKSPSGPHRPAPTGPAPAGATAGLSIRPAGARADRTLDSQA